MFKKFLSAASAIVLASAFALTPAAADGFEFDGNVDGDYNAWSLGGSGGFNGGNGTIDERTSWAGSVTENSGEMNLKFTSGGGLSGKLDLSSSASAGAGNYIATKGAGASSTYSVSGSGVIGGINADVAGSGNYTNN